MSPKCPPDHFHCVSTRDRVSGYGHGGLGNLTDALFRKLFVPLHPPDALDILSEDAHLGPVDPTTLPAPTESEPTEEEKRIEQERRDMPSSDAMLLIDDFEFWAEKVLSGTAWNYYKSAADREISESSLL